jgi:hypothetical protein
MEKHAAQFQSLPGDGQDQEADPPRDEGVDGPPGQPEAVADDPGPGPSGHDDDIGGGLNREHHAEDRHEAEAPRRHEHRAQVPTDAREGQDGPNPGTCGGQKRPGPVQRHGPLQANHRAQEATHHERSVDGGQGRLQYRSGPAKAQQPAPQPAQQGEEARAHKAEAEAGLDSI